MHAFADWSRLMEWIWSKEAGSGTCPCLFPNLWEIHWDPLDFDRQGTRSNENIHISSQDSEKKDSCSILLKRRIFRLIKEYP